MVAERWAPPSRVERWADDEGNAGYVPDKWLTDVLLAEDSLAEFVRQAWHVVEPSTPFIDGWHLDAISEHLEAVTSGDIRDLIINIPPRSMKSLLVSVFWPTWEWGPRAFPHLRYVFNSYAETLSIRDALKSRRVIQSLWYQQRWGDRYKLTSDQNAKTRYDNDKTGFRLATSVGGANTGEGGDRIVADDPHNVIQSESELVRESVLRWWDEAMTTRRNKPGSSARIVVMQRVHEGDLTGHLLADIGGYHHLCLPMEWEPPVYIQGYKAEPGTSAEELRANRDPFKPQPHDECPIHKDPRHEPGQLLWEERFPRVAVLDWAKSMGPYAASGQLQQRPTPRSGVIFDPERIKPLPVWFDQPTPTGKEGVMTTFRKSLKRVIFIDLAWSEKGTADYTAMCHLGSDASDQTYILDVFNERVDELDLAAVTAPLIVAWKPDLIGVEEGAFQQAATRQFIQRLYKKLRALKFTVGVVPVKPSRDKVMRAQLPAGRAKAGLVYGDKAAPWWPRFEAQLSGFPLANHDDMVDAWSGAEQLAVEKVDWTDPSKPRETYLLGDAHEDDPEWDPFDEYNETFAKARVPSLPARQVPALQFRKGGRPR